LVRAVLTSLNLAHNLLSPVRFFNPTFNPSLLAKKWNQAAYEGASNTGRPSAQ
jgi:hypothetical protein